MVTRKRLPRSDEESRRLVEKMKSTIRNHPTGAVKDYKILKVEKIDNKRLWKRYEKRMKEIASETDDGKPNETWLFHGTDSADSILETGFDVQHANPNAMFGPGLYFAWSSSKANQYVFGGSDGVCTEHGAPVCPDCVRTMLSCKVCLGIVKTETAAVARNKPPPGYHSVKGERGTNLRYSEFVVYDNDQACPRYLVTYKVVPR